MSPTSLVQHIIQSDLDTYTKILQSLGYTIVITSDVADVKKACGRNLDANASIRLEDVSRVHNRATGGAHPDSKFIIILGTENEHIQDIEIVLIVLLHEMGHCIPFATSDELLAWNRALSWATLITPRMWAVIAPALASYNIKTEYINGTLQQRQE